MPIKSFLYSAPKVNHEGSISLVKKKKPHQKIKPIKILKAQKKEAINLTKSNKQTFKGSSLEEELIKNSTINIKKAKVQIKSINKWPSYENTPYEYKVTKQLLKTKSIFNQNPRLVPKSTTPHKNNIKQKKRTINYGHHMSISKDEEGNCTMTQDLTAVGIEGLTVNQYFKCGGKTKFEQGFSQHMKKTMEIYK